MSLSPSRFFTPANRFLTPSPIVSLFFFSFLFFPFPFFVIEKNRLLIDKKKVPFPSKMTIIPPVILRALQL